MSDSKVQRTYEHMFLELKERLTNPNRSGKYLVLWPNASDGWTAALEEPMPVRAQVAIAATGAGQTPRDALQALLEGPDVR